MLVIAKCQLKIASKGQTVISPGVQEFQIKLSIDDKIKKNWNLMSIHKARSYIAGNWVQNVGENIAYIHLN